MSFFFALPLGLTSSFTLPAASPSCVADFTFFVLASSTSPGQGSSMTSFAIPRFKVTFTPDGGEPDTKSKKIKLVKRG